MTPLEGLKLNTMYTDDVQGFWSRAKAEKDGDLDCRDNCNPYSIHAPFLTCVLSKTRIRDIAQDERPQVLSAARLAQSIDPEGHVGIKCKFEFQGKEVKGRMLFKYEGVQGADGQLWLYKLTDLFNTKVCEQTFAMIEMFGNMMRTMETGRAEFYFQEMLTEHNNMVTARLERLGLMQSVPPDPWVDHSVAIRAKKSVPLPTFQALGTVKRWWQRR
ncbi:hypothetical protein VOLCADRAFT_93463 [Volvox carteri f. nagariensis]|uniref:Uncharacterized protein n=1 Tax=Volvox carteri f. nagariensis TaxID=3068 RepID=D8U269_VOLCA|nr:uncharacterized protein VOLCADRAFT_93463 [Volvox carteri f. nagariensis]EFJ46312.1 hypothetical protein VOLCADRAFT_93463 [Volvox carteri f. nagariensis]|eukprot:XP_002952759.1 hypothetical protein VOLCADRAFT_93463 [Volvox carteri f. nagariensis]